MRSPGDAFVMRMTLGSPRLSGGVLVEGADEA
jgi:hypothetical protein